MPQRHLDRLSSIDASFLHQEGPSSHMHIGAVLVFDGGGRQLLPAGSAEEAEQLVKLVKAYGFDELCQVGTTSAALKFLAKAR